MTNRIRAFSRLCIGGRTCLQFTGPKTLRLIHVEMKTFSVRAFIPPLRRRCVPLQATRRYAMQAPGAPTLEIFSNQHKWQQKERAASNPELSRSVDYLRDEVASRLCERILVRGLGAKLIAQLLTCIGHQSPLRPSSRSRSQCL